MILTSLLLACVQAAPAQQPPPGLKVYLLAGQSNMEGQAVVDLDHEEHYNGGKGNLEHVLREPEMSERFGFLREEDGTWATREDVWVSYQTNHELKAGDLSIGYAVYGGRNHFGAELMLGWHLGELHDEQVLLVKTCWGGKSLHKDFRPPSADGETGPFYEQMIAEYRATLAALPERFPGAEKLEPELAGFVWFQGWNDMVSEEATAEYEDNLVHLIQDVRRDLAVPDLPVVVGETGNCDNERLRGAQEAATERPEVGPRCVFVATAAFRRPADESPNTGHGHHWFGNAASYLEIGDALGSSLSRLVEGGER